MASGTTTKKESDSSRRKGRKKKAEKDEQISGGAVWLRRLECQGRGSSIQRISCPVV